jgi:hypothetical protein
MAEETSDPNIVSRLAKLPPFDDEVPPEPVVEEVKEEVKVEETEDEQKKRTTEQFEKLKQHNAELKKQLEEQKVPQKNALDALIPESPVTNQIPNTQQFPTLTPKEIKDTFAGLTDENGYVDTGLLKETLVSLQKAKEESEKRAADAEQVAKNVSRRQDDFERKQIMKEVHGIYPKLDPENAISEDPEKKFDQRFYDLFQGQIMREWTSAGTADPMKVAEKVSDILYPKDMTKATKEKAEAAELAKKNINATTVKPTSTSSSYKNQDELILATRKGRPGALAERLRAIGQ